jgi:hypothetical protein
VLHCSSLIGRCIVVLVLCFPGFQHFKVISPTEILFGVLHQGWSILGFPPCLYQMINICESLKWTKLNEFLHGLNNQVVLSMWWCSQDESFQQEIRLYYSCCFVSDCCKGR